MIFVKTSTSSSCSQCRLPPTNIFADARFTEEFEQLQFPKGPQAKHRVIKGCDLLDCHLPTTGPMDSRAHNTVRTLTDDIEYLVLGT
jgi:hypothetical protein